MGETRISLKTFRFELTRVLQTLRQGGVQIVVNDHNHINKEVAAMMSISAYHELKRKAAAYDELTDGKFQEFQEGATS